MRSIVGCLFVVTFFSHCALALKFLAFNPILFHSPANFLGKISDALVEAGHEVVMLSPIMHAGYPNISSKLARVIHIPPNDLMRQFEMIETKSAAMELWTISQADPFGYIEMMHEFTPSWNEMCRVTLETPGLIEQLKEERFDAAFSEIVEYCGFGLFHLLGIDKFAVTSSLASLDGLEHITGVPAFTSFQPALFSLYGDRMSMFARFSNILFHYGWARTLEVAHDELQGFFDRRYPEMPKLDDIVKKSSFIFLNTDPLIDFPHLASPKMVNLGGIALPSKSNPLKEVPLASLMSARPRTVLVSFGSVMYSSLMPDPFKETIRSLARSFPDVTFIWKYENPEDKVAAGIPNLHTFKWLPQADILRDRRLTAFVTHGGSGSSYEAIISGVPTITVPVMSDQIRNGEMMRRLKTGRIIQRDELATPEPLIDAVKDVLENESYKKRALHVAAMYASQPQPVRERLVRHFEFMARFGPLDQLDHAGREMGVVQFYNLDIFGAAATLVILAGLIVLTILRRLLRVIVCNTGKWKTD